jgi:hypothetical protein
MGTLSIIESASIARDGSNPQPVHEFSRSGGIPCTQLSTSTTSARVKLKGSTVWVTLNASEAMYIQIGDVTVDATTTDFPIAADVPYSFKVNQELGSTYIAAEDVA